MTYQDYMRDSTANHHTFYAQFASFHLRGEILRRWPLDELRKAKELGESLNSIPLVAVDSFTAQYRGLSEPMRAMGAPLTLSTRVCAVKAAMREILADVELA